MLNVLFFNYNYVAVQIHYDFERKHWVTSSFVNGNVQLYDSLSNGSISDSLKVQLAQIYKNACSYGYNNSNATTEGPH